MNRIFTQRNALPIVVALLLTAPGLAAARDSGLQLTPDGKQTLISKDVGDERWVIVRAEDETVSGNVFLHDGGAPLFVWCEPREGSGDDPVELACYGADACPAAPCEEGAWAFIADVDLPASFFAPPVSPEPMPTGTPTPGPTPSSTPTSSSTPTGTSSPGADDDVRCCVAADDGPKCEDRTPAECAARGGVDLGAGSCDPNPCS